MAKCWHCEKEIESGFLFGFWGPNNETKPICISCLKKILESDGNETGIKQRIEKWLKEEIGANTRETELLKKVLSDIFKDLQ